MKEKILPFRQIEWWVVTFLFVSIILSNVMKSSDFYFSGRDGVVYFAKLFIPLIFLASFYFVHMKLIPIFLRDKKLFKLTMYSGLIVFVSFFTVGAFSMGARFSNDFMMPFYFNTLAIYAGYLAIIYIINQILLNKDEIDFRFYNVLRFVLIYLFIVIFLFQFEKIAGDFITIIFVIVIPAIIGLVMYNFFLIYRLRNQGRKGESNAFYVLLIAVFIGLFLSIAIGRDDPRFLLMGVVIILSIVAILFPLSNFFFRKYDNYLGKLNKLTVKVDQGTANLSFLRSQINPHFLFNALNTLYGTSLQEQADRTAEGIQKLGDMMRFMLHENNQDQIPVEREKEYLVNYIDLQNLRIKEHDNIEIIFNRTEDGCTGMIAPMLLIPFVENAFKHGISLQKKSWIKISLRCLEGSVHLDVNNSIHRSNDEDPEKKASGIGLENVKQRLNLLYPNDYELMIRENEIEYFVHLSVKL
ncbi:sensor histidine kinase [Belliella kenyensis]|uniref:Sensor histidine kinase n=1 Tax=Belliella kenyensis TaxID=1472724 RepID=A0ABV8ELD7_9BACT|nr:histidine kinase [Belliella kenyensis]MCH7400468.1 histidine kinase [Belliella kenyensis]MDN3604516.1 histidine kinase [Belliella kenyensis]